MSSVPSSATFLKPTGTAFGSPPSQVARYQSWFFEQIHYFFIHHVNSSLTAVFLGLIQV